MSTVQSTWHMHMGARFELLTPNAMYVHHNLHNALYGSEKSTYMYDIQHYVKIFKF